jgi:hypothetical protein
MDAVTLSNIQQRVNQISIPKFERLHEFSGVPNSFAPWTSGLSPSALYNCSLSCRKHMKIKTPEVKWMSIKRWVTTTPEGIVLPAGVYLSIKRREVFVAQPNPHFEKKEFILMMFPYGNVWSMISMDVPITEEWLWSQAEDGKMIFEHLMRKDAARPIHGYFRSCREYMTSNPDQIGIHLKRKKKDVDGV